MGSEGLLFSGNKVSVWDDKNVLEIHSGDGSTIEWLYWIPLNCTQTYKKRLKNPSNLSHDFWQNKLDHHSVIKSFWTLRPHGLQHARPPCPSPTPGVCSNTRPLSQGCHPTISYSVIPFSSGLQSSPASRSFLMSRAFHIKWPKYWSFSFSINPSNKYSGLISFRIDWFDLLAVLGTLKSSPERRFESINSLALSLLYGPILTAMWLLEKTTALTRRTFVTQWKSPYKDAQHGAFTTAERWNIYLLTMWWISR